MSDHEGAVDVSPQMVLLIRSGQGREDNLLEWSEDFLHGWAGFCGCVRHGNLFQMGSAVVDRLAEKDHRTSLPPVPTVPVCDLERNCRIKLGWVGRDLQQQQQQQFRGVD